MRHRIGYALGYTAMALGLAIALFAAFVGLRGGMT